VAGDHGIQEVDLEGKVLRTLSKIPAREGCYLAKHEGVLFLAADYSLWTVMLPDGIAKRIAKLPKTVKSCERTPEYPKGQTFPMSEYTVHPHGRFEVDKSGDRACISLGRDEASPQVDILLDLKTGKVRSHGMSCKRDESLKLTCQSNHWFDLPPTPADRANHPYGLSDGDLVKWGPDGKPTVIAPLKGGFDEGRISPSGTWMAIGGNEREDSTFYSLWYEIYFLNRMDGQIWPILETGTAPMTPKQMAHLEMYNLNTEAVVGDECYWIPGHDLLLLNRNLLAIPGRDAVKLPGKVVF
jgi:hypothetical protein